MPQMPQTTLGKEQEVSNTYSMSKYEQLMYNDIEQLIEAARNGEIGYFDGTLADSRGNKVRYKNPKGAMEFFAGQGGLDKLGEILSGQKFSFLTPDEHEERYNEIMGIEEETVETVSPQTARPTTQGAQGLKDGFDGTDNNELYLTDGQRKAILSGSATVDMTKDQLEAIGRNTGKAASKFNLSALINTMVGKSADALSGIGELLAEAKDAQKQNKMVGEEVLTEGTTYTYDIDGNPTTFSYSETEDIRHPQQYQKYNNVLERFMTEDEKSTPGHKANGGILSLAAGGPTPPEPESSYSTPFSDNKGGYIASSNTVNVSDPITSVTTGGHHSNDTTFTSTNTSANTDKKNKDKYNQIVDSAGTGNINMQEIVDFREESGMDGAEYSAFLDKIKERSGNEAFYDAGFVKGPGEMVQNWIKSGGFLGNILKTVLQGGKDAGVAALDKVTDFKEYLSNFGDGVMANQPVEKFTEVQEDITGYEDSSDVFKLPPNYKFSDSNYMGSNLSMDPNKGFYIAGNPNPTYFNLPQIEQGSYDDSAITSNIYAGRSPTDEMFASNFTMNPSDPNSFPMSRQYNQMFKDNMLSDGGGLFPQMTPNDPLMNSFNKTPLSVLERDNGGVTRQQYMQKYAPKTAAQMLGIVDTYDEEGIMGV